MARISQEPGEVTFSQAIKDFFKGYVDFKGRTTRAGYWWVQLILILINFIMLIGFYAFVFGTLFSMFLNIDYLESSYVDESYVFSRLGSFLVVYFIWLGIYLVYNLAMFLPSLALTIRRYRDTGLRARGTVILWIVYMTLLPITFILPFTSILFLGIVFQFNMFFLIVSILPSDELTISADNQFLEFFFRKKVNPETIVQTDSDTLDF